YEHTYRPIRHPPPVPTRRSSDLIERHTQRINRIVSDVISISQGKQPSMASTDLGGFVNAAMHQWAEENKAVERISLTAATAPLYVYFDPSQLAQVFSNLTDNALRYSTGEVRITLGYTLQNDPCITISDDGPRSEERRVGREWRER